MIPAAARRRYGVISAVTTIVAGWWTVLIVTGYGGPAASQAFSNVGLVVVTLAASAACVAAARRNPKRRRAWGFLAASTFSWGAGMVLWTWYETVLEREVPFPSLADVGYLGAVPFMAAALISLSPTSQSVAGRIRTVLDGMIIAGSLLLTSWIVVLEPVFHAGGDTLLSQVISLAYPIGDVIVVTMVLYVLLRVRQTRRKSAFPVGLIAAGLLAFAFADSGFAYLTATGAYSSGNVIDVGWFLGYVLIFIAAFKPTPVADDEELEVTEGRSFALLLPYAAVGMSLATSSIELLRTGSADPVVSWLRTFIIAAMVVRQILTLLENIWLTRRLEARVVDLRASEQRFKGLVQHSSDVVTLIDAQGTVLYQSDSVERVFGYLSDALIGRPIADLLDRQSAEMLADAVAELASDPYGIRVLEVRVRHRSRRLCHAEMTVTNLLDNASVRGFVLNTRDISERKTLEDQLVHSAFHDSLTALANRALFRERVDDTLEKEAGEKRELAVLFLDLDGFKQVNDLLGHASGDLLLVQVAERLRECVRPTDTVARLGGDEFAILLEDPEDLDPTAVSKRIISALRNPFRVDGQEIHVGGSVGIAHATSDILDGDKLLRNADLAMYRAKAAGGDGFARYNAEMHVDLVERLQLEADLRRAIEGGELVLHYQPTVELGSGKVLGAEALVRWQHPTRGLVPPDQFVPLAEQSGLIEPMGRWVLNEACSQAVAWRQTHPNLGLTVSVNISSRQQHSAFVDDVAEILHRTGLEADRLVLEVTESVLMDHTEENLALFERLKGLGVRIAIDDFGTGYSSLSYLHRFPVDILKIDRMFIERIGESEHDAELVRTIVRLGESLRMETIAEGIEGRAQLQALLEMGCEFGQGFYFARPLSSESFPKVLDAEVLPRRRATGRSKRVAA